MGSIGIAKLFECLKYNKLFLDIRNTKIFVVLDGNVVKIFASKSSNLIAKFPKRLGGGAEW